MFFSVSVDFGIVYTCFTEIQCNGTDVICCHGNLCNTKTTPTNSTLTLAPPTNNTLAPPTNTTLTLAPPTNTTRTQAPPTNTTLTLAPPTNTALTPLQCYNCFSFNPECPVVTCDAGMICGKVDDRPRRDLSPYSVNVNQCLEASQVLIQCDQFRAFGCR
ncbi:hypothetical protein WMY93_033177 [Mugilogobius chulae]|uniref:UPAR/Ly6 domain-containing protein n=1 Tax=Mugilogobius chulae TaxID=88201 RepID=A0AAW0MKW1_9GOBI